MTREFLICHVIESEKLLEGQASCYDPFRYMPSILDIYSYVIGGAFQLPLPLGGIELGLITSRCLGKLSPPGEPENQAYNFTRVKQSVICWQDTTSNLPQFEIKSWNENDQ